MLTKGEALIQGARHLFMENKVHIFISVIYCSSKFIKNTLPKITDFFTENYWRFLPKNGVTLPIFNLPKFTVTELIFFTIYRPLPLPIFQKIIYRPTPNPKPNGYLAPDLFH